MSDALVADLREWAGQYLEGTLEGQRILYAAAHRIEQLEAALEPFAKWMDALDPEYADHEDDVIAGGRPGASANDSGFVTFGDLRRARTLARNREISSGKCCAAPQREPNASTKLASDG
jgi:hypothetical protein